jgi:thiamine biosynthesis lipoprotein
MWKLSRAAVGYAKATGGVVDVTIAPLLKALKQGDNAEDAFRRVGIHKIALDAQNRTIRFIAEGLEMDFGGLAKGYAARRAAEVLRRWDVSSALVNLGGSSILTQGAEDWLVGIADPASPNRYAAIISVKPDRAVTCSGTYERCIETPTGLVSEIVDPRTGQPLTGLRAAVAITSSPVLGEVLSKALLLDGSARSSAKEFLLVTGKPEGPAIDPHLSRTPLFT